MTKKLKLIFTKEEESKFKSIFKHYYEITKDVFHTFAEYLKAKNDWNEDFFKC